MAYTPTVWAKGDIITAEKLNKLEQGVQNEQVGPVGAAAGFGTPIATVNNAVGVPSVTVTATGEDTAKVFNFEFKNIKGEQGEAGAKGDAGEGVPIGGMTGQILAKKTDADYDTEWIAVTSGGSSELPTGGTTGQVLGKLSDTNGDVGWVDTEKDFVVTCMLESGGGATTVKSMDKTFSEIYQACTDGKNVVLKAYMEETKSYFYNMIPAMVQPAQIAFAMTQPASSDSGIGIAVLVASTDEYSVILQNIGSTESPVMWISASINMENSTAMIAAQFADILSALNAGKIVYVKATMTGSESVNYVFTPLFFSSVSIAFECMNSAAKMGLQLNIDSANTVSVATTQFS